VVLATGHCWPEEPEARPGYFLSPFPATALQRIPATTVGVRGSSLTAIDAAVAIAVAHGSFVETDDGGVMYRTNPGSESLRIVMMSRKGLLPEADYHPVPYEALAICTPQAIEALIDQACDTLLDEAYALFKRELAHADSQYAARVNLDELELEDFADRYFADRADERSLAGCVNERRKVVSLSVDHDRAPGSGPWLSTWFIKPDFVGAAAVCAAMQKNPHPPSYSERAYRD